MFNFNSSKLVQFTYITGNSFWLILSQDKFTISSIMKTFAIFFFWSSLFIVFFKVISAATSKNSRVVIEKKNNKVAFKLIHKNVQN